MENLIPRDKMPPGCHWEGGNFVWGDKSPPPDDDHAFSMQESAGYYDLADALFELVDAAAELEQARYRHTLAINRVRIADSRSDYLQGLPGSPWLIDGHVVQFVPGQYPPYDVEPVSDMNEN